MTKKKKSKPTSPAEAYRLEQAQALIRKTTAPETPSLALREILEVAARMREQGTAISVGEELVRPDDVERAVRIIQAVIHLEAATGEE